MTTTTTNPWTDNHPFTEDEDRSEFRQHSENPHWVSWCKTCGSIGFATKSGWKHKALRKVYRQYKAEEWTRANPR